MLSLLRAAHILLLLSIIVTGNVCAQTGSPSAAVDSLEPRADSADYITFKGYVEGYIALDGAKPPAMSRPLLYNFNRDREFALNLAFLEVRGQYKNLRFKFIPAFGSYMQANYAKEPEGFRYLFEANAGMRVWSKHNVWLDVGILPSPFGYEGAVNLLQNNLTRSLSAENSPYYLSGARLSAPLGSKVMVNLFAINGWQNIRETNYAKSLALQVQYQVSDQVLLNYGSYVGNERTWVDSLPGTAYRSFQDFFINYKPNGKLNLVALFDFGTQNGYTGRTQFWHTGNVTARYQVVPRLSLNLRAEYYSDPRQAMLALPQEDATLYGGSAGLSYGLLDKVLLRIESRALTSDRDVFGDASGRASKTYLYNTAALSIYL